VGLSPTRGMVYEGSLKISWNRLINPSQNFVEDRWRSLFRIISLVKRCTSFNAPPTSRKRATDRWSLRNFLPRSSFFMVGKANKSHGAISGLYGGRSNGVSPIQFFQAQHKIQFRSLTFFYVVPSYICRGLAMGRFSVQCVLLNCAKWFPIAEVNTGSE
jgi:hypothetical protein